MKSIIKVIKGGLIGIGNILPGISGSMIAVILNIYQELIDALNNIFTHPVKAVKSVWQYIVGAILGILLGLLVVSYLLDIIPLPITLLFVGFIIGAIPTLYKQFRGTTVKWHHIVVFLAAAVMMLSVIFLPENTSEVHGFWYHVSVVFVGVIYAIAMIIPGLSGATMLMAFGFYDILLEMVDSISTVVSSGDIGAGVSQLPVLLLLILGAAIGLVVMGKIMAIFMKRFPKHFIVAVLGIVVVSPINILVLLQRDTVGNVYAKPWYIYLISLVAFIIGIYATLKLANGQKKTEGETLND